MYFFLCLDTHSRCTKDPFGCVSIMTKTKGIFTHHLLVQNSRFCLTFLCNSRLAHHEAMLMRRTQIRGSDSSEDSDGDNDDEENDDMEWGPATEL